MFKKSIGQRLMAMTLTASLLLMPFVAVTPVQGAEIKEIYEVKYDEYAGVIELSGYSFSLGDTFLPSKVTIEDTDSGSGSYTFVDGDVVSQIVDDSTIKLTLTTAGKNHLNQAIPALYDGLGDDGWGDRTIRLALQANWYKNSLNVALGEAKGDIRVNMVERGPIVASVNLELDKSPKTLYFEGGNFRKAWKTTADLTKITLSDTNQAITLSNTSECDISSDRVTITISNGDLANLKGLDLANLLVSTGANWLNSEVSGIITDQSVQVFDEVPIGQEISKVNYYQATGKFIIKGAGFQPEDALDLSKISIMYGDSVCELSAADAQAVVVDQETIRLELTPAGKDNLLAALPNLGDGEQLETFQAKTGWYMDWAGKPSENDEINVDLAILPSVELLGADVDRVYYYREGGEGGNSDELSFNIIGLPEGLSDLKAEIGYIYEGELIPTGAVSNVDLEPVAQNGGTYTFTVPIENQLDNDLQPLAIHLWANGDYIEEPFELLGNGEQPVYVNILPPGDLVEDGFELTDLSIPDLNLNSMVGFTVYKPEFGRIVAKQPLNILANLEDFRYLSDYIKFVEPGFFGVLSNSSLFHDTALSVYMDGINVSKVPYIKVYFDLDFVNSEDGVADQLVSNVNYNPETKVLSFDTTKCDLFQAYLPVICYFEDIDPDQGELKGTISWDAEFIPVNVLEFQAWFLDANRDPIELIGDPVSVGSDYSIDLPENTAITDNTKYIGIFTLLDGVDDPVEVDRLAVIDRTELTSESTSITINADTKTDTTVRVPADVYNATVNLGALVQPNGDQSEATLNHGLKAQIETTTNESIDLELPANVTISAPAGWVGELNLPTILPNTQVTISGATVATVIEVGYGDVPLTLDKAAKLVFPGHAGKKVGFQRGNQFTEIAQVLEYNTQACADADIAPGGDAKIEVGEDLIVWTKHFTKFATYTVTETNPPGNGGGGDDSGSSGTTVPVVTPPQEVKTFGDLAKHWAAADIQVLANKGLIQGKSDNVFAPDQNITRAELVAILVRGLGLKTASTQQLPKDVQPNAWYAQSINAAVEAGLITGYADGNIRPQANITREELAVILARATKMLNLTVPQGAEQSVTFVDANNISSWARTSVESAVAAELIKGNTAGSFLPGKTTTRAEAAVMIKRLLEKGSLI